MANTSVLWWNALAVAVPMALAGCTGGDDTTGKNDSALTYPSPGDTLAIGFELDAADQPIARGTYIDEQYTDVGVHFNGAFAVGARPIDFPNYTVAPLTDAMICTWVAWQDSGLCFPPVGIMSAQMVVDLDYDACDVTIEGRTRGDGQQDGDILTMTAYDAGGAQLTTISEYVNTGPNPPHESIVNGTVSAGGIRRVIIEDGELDALDTLVIHRCEPENQPPVALCGDGEACNSPGQCNGVATIDVGSSDPDGDPLTITQAPPPPYPVGTTPVTLSVSDGTETATCAAEVTISDCEDPAIACPPPVTLECAGNGCAPYTPGGATATDNCGIAGQNGPGAQCFPLGTTSLGYDAHDAAGNAASCQSAVTVVDTQPPVVTVGPSPALAPPNHKYHTVSLADCGVSIIDACQGPLPVEPPNASITCVSSDEPDDDTGDGSSVDDIVILDPTHVKLRAERKGNGDGRVYNINFTTFDAAGNPTPGTCTVDVMKGNHVAIDSGPAQTVCL